MHQPEIGESVIFVRQPSRSEHGESVEYPGTVTNVRSDGRVDIEIGELLRNFVDVPHVSELVGGDVFRFSDEIEAADAASAVANPSILPEESPAPETPAVETPQPPPVNERAMPNNAGNDWNTGFDAGWAAAHAISEPQIAAQIAAQENMLAEMGKAAQFKAREFFELRDRREADAATALRERGEFMAEIKRLYDTIEGLRGAGSDAPVSSAADAADAGSPEIGSASSAGGLVGDPGSPAALPGATGATA